MNVILRRVFAASLLLLPMSLLAQTPAPAPAPRLNVDYTLLATPQPVYSPVKGKIEVAEVFSYACPHCADVSADIAAWSKTKSPDINFVYVHAVGMESWERFARGFYAAEIKNIQARSHEDIFKAVFVQQTLSHNASLEEIAKFYSRYGVPAPQMLAIMQSPSVNTRLNRSKQFSIRTTANSTPTIIVAGKYKVMATREGGKAMTRTVDFLVAKERAAIAARTPAAPATPPVKK